MVQPTVRVIDIAKTPQSVERRDITLSYVTGSKRLQHDKNIYTHIGV
jgi:hypothetical protein|tara:strand:+ start:107 stop:247 length:141 start_codon:yes stop_codon:yes gene_type:complete